MSGFDDPSPGPSSSSSSSSGPGSATSTPAQAQRQLLTKAETLFTEALQHNPQSLQAIVGLAKISRAKGDLDDCKAHARKVLSADPSVSEAAIMLSDAMFHSRDEAEKERAAEPLEALLKAAPSDYGALERLVGQYRRAGKLDQVTPFLKAAVAHDGRAEAQPGYHFCVGLYARYVNDVGKAIAELNLARRDEEWGESALVNMIELYLNPNQDHSWEEVSHKGDGSGGGSSGGAERGPLDEASAENIAAADTLMRELRAVATDRRRVKVLEAYCLLATRSKTNVDKAMSALTALLDQDQDYIPAILGTAVGFIVEGNKHKAQNLLKRVAKVDASDGMVLVTGAANDFTRASLLLARFYVEKSKFDLAQDICKRVLAENKSSSSAWDVLGSVMEKEGDYDKAG